MGVVYMSDLFYPEGRWYIYTTNAAPLAAWQAFNVYYVSPQSNVVSVENSSSGSTTMTLSQPLINGVSGAASQLTHKANSFTHIATVANISPATVTVLDNPLTNNNPWAMVFVTPNGSPNGASKLIDEAPIGVFYNNHHWSIFNENAASMTVDTGYNIFVVQRYPVFLPQVKK